MNTYWLNKLFEVLRIQTNSENEKLMVLYLDKELGRLKLSYTIDAPGNILVTKGNAKTYPCVTSHMDTVHSFVPNFKLHKDIDDNDILFAMNNKQRTGIGGDDKCGIFACLHLLKVIPQIKVVFFSREEIGCRGSGAIDKEFFSDCRYLIQLDRKGSEDFIQTYWDNKTVSHDFSSEIGLVKKKYKYKNTHGTVTDVMKLWQNKVGISCINLSCGYYNPHTIHEYISISDLWHSIKFTEEIINTMKPKRYVSLPPKPTVTKVSYDASSYTSNYKSIFSQCCKCKKWKKNNLLYDDKRISIDQKICWSCKKKLYSKDEWDNKLSSAIAKTSSQLSAVAQQNNDPILFACEECGIKTDEMKAGDKLKYINGKLYCSKCAVLVSTSDEKNSPVICEVCQEEIPQGAYSTTIQGMLICKDCAVDLGEYTSKICWVCNKVIPKDHKIIERFGTRVCEDCACPSDTEILDD